MIRQSGKQEEAREDFPDGSAIVPLPPPRLDWASKSNR